MICDYEESALAAMKRDGTDFDLQPIIHGPPRRARPTSCNKNNFTLCKHEETAVN